MTQAFVFAKLTVILLNEINLEGMGHHLGLLSNDSWASEMVTRKKKIGCHAAMFFLPFKGGKITTQFRSEIVFFACDALLLQKVLFIRCYVDVLMWKVTNNRQMVVFYNVNILYSFFDKKKFTKNLPDYSLLIKLM